MFKRIIVLLTIGTIMLLAFTACGGGGSGGSDGVSLTGTWGFDFASTRHVVEFFDDGTATLDFGGRTTATGTWEFRSGQLWLGTGLDFLSGAYFTRVDEENTLTLSLTDRGSASFTLMRLQ